MDENKTKIDELSAKAEQFIKGYIGKNNGYIQEAVDIVDSLEGDRSKFIAKIGILSVMEYDQDPKEVLGYFDRVCELVKERRRIGNNTNVTVKDDLAQRVATVGTASDANKPTSYDEFLKEHTEGSQAPGFAPGETGKKGGEGKITMTDSVVDDKVDAFFVDHGELPKGAKYDPFRE
jgi:hypothetical protein